MKPLLNYFKTLSALHHATLEWAQFFKTKTAFNVFLTLNNRNLHDKLFSEKLLLQSP